MFLLQQQSISLLLHIKDLIADAPMRYDIRKVWINNGKTGMDAYQKIFFRLTNSFFMSLRIKFKVFCLFLDLLEVRDV